MEQASEISGYVRDENMPVGLVYVEGGHLTLNAVAERITGYNRNELTTLDDWSLMLNDEHLQAIRELSAQNLQDDSISTSVSVTLVRKNGEQSHVEISACVFEGHEIWILFDMTKLFHADEDRYIREQALQSTSSGVIIVDARQQDNPAVYVNKAFESISGYSAQEVIGRNLRFLHNDDLAQPGVFEIRNAIRQGREKKALLRNYRKDGTLYWNELTISPVHNREGILTHFVGIQNDITQQQLDQEALLKSEYHLRAILEAASDSIISINQNGTITDINPATEKMFGYTRQELLFQKISILMPAPWCYEHDRYIRQYLETGKATVIGTGRELMGKRKDGSTFPIYLSVSQVEHANIFTGIIRDMSEHKELQKQVLEIAAQEDRRIGLELHDDIQQQLTGIGMMTKTVSNRLSKMLDEDPRLSDIAALVKEIEQGLNKSVSHVNLLARGLVPVDVDAEGLRAALTELSSRLDRFNDIECEFISRGNVNVTDNFIATHLYRIAQEAVNNAIKHSQSKHLSIELVGDAEKISLTVKDGGVGLTNQDSEHSGLGLRIMKYRANLIGATVSVNAGDEGGVKICCILPRAG